MDPDSIRGLMMRLINGTNAGKLKWEETAEDEDFRLILDAGIIHIRRSNQMRPGLGDYALLIFNKNNTLVGRSQPKPDTEDMSHLSKLFDLARNSALNPSGLLDRLEEELKKRSG